MKAGKTLTRVGRPERQFPRRLWFEQLESRQMLSASGGPLSAWGGAEAAADAVPASDQATTVMIRLQATDLCGQPVERVAIGDTFWLEVHVKDLRPGAQGVFAAYLDVDYDQALVSTGGGGDAGLVFGTTYENGKSAEFLPGLIDDAGAFAGFDKTYGDEYLVFAVPLTATTAGVTQFAAGPADPLGYDILVYGSDDVVPWEEVRVLDAHVSIEAGAEVDRSVGDRIADDAGSLACRTSLIAGSGAELAASNPLWRPRQESTKGPVYPLETYEAPYPAETWADHLAQPPVTEPNVGGGWAVDSWSDWSPSDTVPVTFDWIAAGRLIDPWSWEDSSSTPSYSGGLDMLAVADVSVVEVSFSPHAYTLTFSEAGSGWLTGRTLEFDSGGELVTRLAAGSTAADVDVGFEFATFEASRAGSPREPARLSDPDVSWTNGADPWQPSDFPGWTVPARSELPAPIASRPLAAAPAQRPFDLETYLELFATEFDQIAADLALATR